VWGGYFGSFAVSYRAIAYSRRYSFPNSNKIQPNYSAMVDAEDLAGLIKTLELAKAHIVGHSYGAYTALFLAVKHPELVRTLTLAEPPVRFSGDPLNENVERVVKRLRAAEKGSPEKVVRAFTDGLQGDGAYDKLPEFLRQLDLRNARAAEAFAASEDICPGIDREAIRMLSMPTLLVTGDKTVPWLKKVDEELERLLPEKGRQHVIIRGAGHGMVFQKPEDCRKAILAFLRDH
jgi:pimeloyl-ACP methyl ester carboxylesterase